MIFIVLDESLTFFIIILNLFDGIASNTPVIDFWSNKFSNKLKIELMNPDLNSGKSTIIILPFDLSTL